VALLCTLFDWGCLGAGRSYAAVLPNAQVVILNEQSGTFPGR
jgi:hypothetical protein